jgi:hypothetical protein
MSDLMSSSALFQPSSPPSLSIKLFDIKKEGRKEEKKKKPGY